MAFGERGGRTRAEPALADVRPSDVALGFVAAVLALGGAAAGVVSTAAAVFTESPPLLAPGEVAVAVRPVSPPEADDVIDRSASGASPGNDSSRDDSPGARSGPRQPANHADGGLAATPVAPRPSDAPAPSPADALPERPIGGIKGLPRLTNPSAPSLHGLTDPVEPGFGAGGPAVAPGPADPATSPDDPYAYVDPAMEDPEAPAGSGVVADAEAQDPGGGGDPLADRAVVAYRQRLQRWLSTRFFVTNSGLSRQALKSARIGARLEIADDRTVAGYVIEPGGHPALEAAARRALDQVIGLPLPEPPQHYPGPLQRTIRATFTCTEATCD